MLRLMLNCHSRLCVPFESVFITAVYRRLKQFGDLSRRDNLRALLAEIASNRFVINGNLLPQPEMIVSLQPQTYSEVVDAIFTFLAQRDGKVRWGDKTPSYLSDIDILWKLFPDAHFVHLVRDGRDVALSLRHIAWGVKHLPRCADEWRRKTELAHKMGAMIPAHFLEIRYEDLVVDPEGTLKVICNYLGECFEPNMLYHYENAVNQMPRQSLQWHAASVSPVDPSKVFQWKSRMRASDRIIFESIAGEALEMFGYEREFRPATWLTKLRTLQFYLAN